MDRQEEVASAEHRTKAIQQKLDRLDDAFIYKESIDLGTYERQRDRLREELTLVEIDRHGSKVEEFDVEGILNFAERVLPRASDLWIQASLEQRQRLQRLFFPEGVAFSGKSFDRTVVTSSLFEYLRPLDGSNENLVDLTGIEPVSVDYPRKVAHRRGSDWQIGRRKLCPRLCPNGCLPSTNTVTYGETSRKTSRGSSR